MRSIFSRLRRPRVDPGLDWWGPACTCPTCVSRDARADLHATLRAEGTRYDVEWPSVVAAEGLGGDLPAHQYPAPDWGDDLGGDLAAMAAPLPGMARDDLGTYAEPVVVRKGTVADADTAAFIAAMARAAQAARHAEPAPYFPATPRAHGRHRQTDPLDLILADLRDLDGP